LFGKESVKKVIKRYGARCESEQGYPPLQEKFMTGSITILIIIQQSQKEMERFPLDCATGVFGLCGRIL